MTLARAASDGFVEAQVFGVVADGAPQATVRETRRAEWMTYPAVGTAPKTTGRPETCSNWPSWTVRRGASAAYVRHDIDLETVRGRLKNAEFAAAEAGLFDDAAAVLARARGAVRRLAEHQRTDRCTPAATHQASGTVPSSTLGTVLTCGSASVAWWLKQLSRCDVPLTVVVVGCHGWMLSGLPDGPGRICRRPGPSSREHLLLSMMGLGRPASGRLTRERGRLSHVVPQTKGRYPAWPAPACVLRSQA